MATLAHDTATNGQLIALCSNPNREVLGGAPYGNEVIKISDQAVIKFGLGVQEGEAENQIRAYSLLNPHTVRVPCVYHSFGNGQLEYIVVENTQGQSH